MIFINISNDIVNLSQIFCTNYVSIKVISELSMFNKTNVLNFSLFFNSHPMLNVFSLNKFFDRDDADINRNRFLSFFFTSMKKSFNFTIEQFHNFFQIRRHRLKLTFARRFHMFKLFTFETTFLFKKN